MKTYYGVDFDKQRAALLKSKPAQKLISQIIEKADAAIGKEYKALKMSEYMLFTETGNRSIFESGYFERRNNCAYISIAYCLTEDEKYIKPLIDLVFHICDEYTWCVPAHVGLEGEPTTETAVETIDLFQAETARLLTDIAAMVGEKLPYYVTDRIKYEIRRRVINSILKNKFAWAEIATSNWAAVCAGGTGVAVLHYAEEEEKEKIIPVLNGAIEHYLDGFNSDGCCLEGCAYWNYGFGYFLIYAKAVLDYSNGEINFFENEKVKQIALFPQRVRMGNTKTVSFSDGGAGFYFSPGTVSLLREVYGEEVSYPDMSFATYIGNVYSVKELLWFDTDYEADSNRYLTTFFDESEWYIKQSKNYSFAVKGGNNGEPHNHNDIGSFMIVAKDESIPLADFGPAEYRNGTFDNNIRYTLLNNGSQGHSVPIINGKTQEYGKEFAARNVNAGEDFFEAYIEGAYAPGLIKRIKRRFDLKENSLVLCDTFEFSDITEEITERVVSWTKPEISDDCVNLESAQIHFDNEKYYVSITKDWYRNHENTADVDVYLIDFKAKFKGETEFKILIDFA